MCNWRDCQWQVEIKKLCAHPTCKVCGATANPIATDLIILREMLRQLSLTPSQEDPKKLQDWIANTKRGEKISVEEITTKEHFLKILAENEYYYSKQAEWKEVIV